ncbi:PREDICTED: fatty-acid-binding protein 3, chloroplastic isoform X1 [Lupinus angustifolius]|uniref:fatty-acid-binding protein 3, chloroplastic isoform X1 n=1 Tax=Lupinus angustifolius TaxID=3871 RepID=UPI00092FCFC1|nr:PREDICTED: fatty-acid-binding protein 3, chloroplastic isoform X1 [Lupinus angustifolius]
MFGTMAASTTLCLSPSINSSTFNFHHKKISNSTLSFTNSHCFSLSAPSLMHFSFQSSSRRQTHFFAAAASSSAASAECVVEPATNVKFQKSLSLPGNADSLVLFGTGYREKVFAIIGVKVYAAGLYLNQSIISELNAWKGQSKDKIQGNSSLFKTIYQSSLEKSLQIILVRDVDGKTFWGALNDAISPRIAKPTTVEETALSTLSRTFLSKPLKKGTFIFLTWVDPSKLLVSISSNVVPSSVDATIESANVSSAIFDVFLGDSPISPSLKASVADGLSKVLN